MKAGAAGDVREGKIEKVLGGGFCTMKINGQEMTVKSPRGGEYNKGQWVIASFGQNEIGQIVGLAPFKMEEQDPIAVTI